MTLFGYGLWNAACNEDHVARNDKARCPRLLNLHIAIYSTDLEHPPSIVIVLSHVEKKNPEFIPAFEGG